MNLNNFKTVDDYKQSLPVVEKYDSVRYRSPKPKPKANGRFKGHLQ